MFLAAYKKSHVPSSGVQLANPIRAARVSTHTHTLSLSLSHLFSRNGSQRKVAAKQVSSVTFISAAFFRPKPSPQLDSDFEVDVIDLGPFESEHCRYTCWETSKMDGPSVTDSSCQSLSRHLKIEITLLFR
jgi:hypothetical protein